MSRIPALVAALSLSLAGWAGAQPEQHHHGGGHEPTPSEPSSPLRAAGEEKQVRAECDESCWVERIKERYEILEKKWPGSTKQIIEGYKAANKNLAEKYKSDPVTRRKKIGEMGSGILEFANVAKKWVESDDRYRGRIPDRLLERIRENLNEAMLEKMGEQHPTIMKVGLERIMDTICPGNCSSRHRDDTVRKSPEIPDSWIGRGRQYQDSDPAKARRDYDQALKLDPKNLEALLGRAYANFKQNDFSAAAADAKAALEIDANNASAQAMLKLAAGRGDGAAPAMTQAAAVPMGAAAAAAGDLSSVNLSAKYVEEARRALSLGDYQSAADRAGRAIAADAENAAAYNLRSIAYNRQRRFDLGLKDALSGLRLDANNGSLLASQAYSLSRLKRYREALAAAQKALESNPEDGGAYRMRAMALAGLGDRRGLLDSLAKAAQFDARNQQLLKAALQQPQDGDLSFLFSDDGESRDAPRSVASATFNRRFGIVAVSSIVGGFLLALGIFQMLVSKRLGRLGKPAVAESGSWPAAPVEDRKPDGIFTSQYKTLRQIGVGGMGVVYEGTDLSLGRRVAIKKMRDEIKSNRRERERFVNEAKLVAGLHHPHIVDIYAIVEDREDLYLIFEFIEGKTLEQMVEDKPLGFSQALPLLRAVASALDFAHDHRVIHRDLKPSNIMVTGQGLVKVMDFGIARLAKETALRYSVTGTVMGTPPYMAPEQQKGMVRKESDFYALAVCLYEMLSGQTPFRGDAAGMLLNKSNKHYDAISALVPGIPEGLDKILDQALDPDPDKRFLSAKEFLLHLDGLAASRRAS